MTDKTHLVAMSIFVGCLKVVAVALACSYFFFLGFHYHDSENKSVVEKLSQYKYPISIVGLLCMVLAQALDRRRDAHNQQLKSSAG